MLDTQPFEVNDFSAGITDFYVNAAKNKSKTCDNLLILRTQDNTGNLILRPGSEIYDAANPQIPSGQKRIGTLIAFDDNAAILTQAERKIYYKTSSAWTILQGPTSNDLFRSATTNANYSSYANWNKHVFITNDDLTSKPSKIYKDGSNVYQLRTAGMPALASAPTATPDSAGAVALSYLYRFVYYYTYTVGTRIFEDFGTTKQVAATDAAGSEIAIGTPCAIASIPVLANGANDNYDTTVVKVKIYRTINNGTTFYYVGQVTNGTTTYSDTSTDAVILAANILLYTEGGVLDHDTPPISKLVHITEDTAYYAHVKEGAEVIVNRIRQSVEGDPDSCPASFFVDVEDEIVGLGSVKGVPLALCKNSVFRVDGFFDDLGRGGMVAQRISDTATCVSGQSVVQTIEYVFWAGKDGFYMADGFQVRRINLGWRTRYKEFVDSVAAGAKIQGKYDKHNNRIWWTVQVDASDNDTVYVLDLNWPLTEDSSFTTISNGASFSPTALEFVDSTCFRADSRGYLFIHRDSLYTDPEVNTAVAASTWARKTIIYNYESAAFNFGTDFVRKFVPRINVTCKNETNLSLQIISNNDDNKRLASLKPLRYRGNMVWGDPDVIWGDPSLVWNLAGMIEEWRRFPANNLRCSYKQIRLTNAFVVITTSDLFGTSVIDNVANTATLTNAATIDWPTNVVGYVIAFESDSYVREYTVSARTTADKITFLDPDNNAPTGTQRWVLRGYPKGEGIHLLSYTIHFAYLGKTQQAFVPTSTGEISS